MCIDYWSGMCIDLWYMKHTGIFLRSDNWNRRSRELIWYRSPSAHLNLLEKEKNLPFFDQKDNPCQLQTDIGWNFTLDKNVTRSCTHRFEEQSTAVELACLPFWRNKYWWYISSIETMYQQYESCWILVMIHIPTTDSITNQSNHNFQAFRSS